MGTGWFWRGTGPVPGQRPEKPPPPDLLLRLGLQAGV